MTNAPHSRARSHLTQSEFKLFASSFPAEVSQLSLRKITQALSRVEKILKKYRSVHANKVSDARRKLLGFRIKSLKEAHARFSKRLERLETMTAASKKSPRKSLTAQPKMKVNRWGTPQDEFKYTEKKKLYAKDTIEPRHKASPGRAMSKRIAGFMKARTRKGQVAQDRITSAKEEP